VGVRPDVEEQLLATILQHPELRADVLNLPPDLFSDAKDRAAFARWQESDRAEQAQDDPVAEHIATLKGLRQPVLGATDARARARDLIDYILRERLIQRHTTVTEEIAAAEEAHGAVKVEEVGRAAWMGTMPEDETLALAQTVIEQLEIGMSIHRRERTELR
jgi:hypothetical protein